VFALLKEKGNEYTTCDAVGAVGVVEPNGGRWRGRGRRKPSLSGRLVCPGI